MKFSLIALTFALVSSIAYADLAQMHQKECETPDVKSLTGESGSCRIVVAPKRIDKQGYCLGTLVGSLPCIVSYISFEDGAAMNMTCAEGTESPVIDQDMVAEAIGYNVALMIKKSDGEDVISDSANDYSLFSSAMLSMLIIESSHEGVATKTGSIFMNFEKGPVSLENVTCH